MLTPEQLNLFEWNDIVEIYNKLNIEITEDIIDRVSQMQEITNTTRYELEVLKQTNGTEIFYNTLEKTNNLTNETKQALTKLFEEVAKADVQSYKTLYKYKGLDFKLSDTQYTIINAQLDNTNGLLQNMTNSIAFAGQQAYINAVDSAYIKAISGAFSWSNAVETAVKELASQGITLKDKAGRNVQLETAVRRNVLTGIRDTARALDKNISEYLGCDGYEVTAHIGARPTHAEAQGKQYAITAEKAKEYNVGLWSDVASLWNEYNCRHDYFGIILGISEPVYSEAELLAMKNVAVTYNGKEIAYYDATQKQRSLENEIRKLKREITVLKDAGFDTTAETIKLKNAQSKLNSFLTETGLNIDYSRLTSTTILTKTTNDNIISKTEINKAVAKLRSSKYEDGTYDLTTMEQVNYSSGYQVTFCQIGDNYSDADFEKLISQFVKLSSDGKVSAGKFESESEISFNVADRQLAIDLAKKFNQISIWNWKRGDIIETGGTGRKEK